MDFRLASNVQSGPNASAYPHQPPPSTTVNNNNHNHNHHHPYTKSTRVQKRSLNDATNPPNIDATITKMDALHNTQFYSWIRNPQNREYTALRLRPLVGEYGGASSLSVTANVLRWVASDWKPCEAKDLFRLLTVDWDEGKKRLLAFYLVRAQREEEGLLVKKRRKSVEKESGNANSTSVPPLSTWAQQHHRVSTSPAADTPDMVSPTTSEFAAAAVTDTECGAGSPMDITETSVVPSVAASSSSSSSSSSTSDEDDYMDVQPTSPTASVCPQDRKVAIHDHTDAGATDTSASTDSPDVPSSPSLKDNARRLSQSGDRLNDSLSN